MSSWRPLTSVLTFLTWLATREAATATAMAIPRKESAMSASDMATVGPTQSGVVPTCNSASVQHNSVPPTRDAKDGWAPAHWLIQRGLGTTATP